METLAKRTDRAQAILITALVIKQNMVVNPKGSYKTQKHQ